MADATNPVDEAATQTIEAIKDEVRDSVQASAQTVPNLIPTNGANNTNNANDEKTSESTDLDAKRDAERRVAGAAASVSSIASQTHTHASTYGTERESSHDSLHKNHENHEKKNAVPRARRMKLSLTQVDPWSVTKVSFMLLIAVGLIQLVAVIFLYFVLDAAGLFSSLTSIVSSAGLSSGGFDISSFLSLGRVVSIFTIIAVFEIVIGTVLAAIGAFLYNIVSSLVGGIHVTLGDD
ncbi:DUF3566 domain-containing protein [Alloscardovia venturai]|uniref:DUF3566 domain-containing protein n=1 Tax=Alloscardovia venturai TaxID=1769421 RepID=A0ABW2Y2Q6_9BIFI